MSLVAAKFETYKSRGAFDPRNGRPVHSFYRYSGPLGPAYVGWTDDDRMTWLESPQIGAATLAWGVVASATVENREALSRGITMKIGSEAILVSGPYGGDVFLRLKSDENEWTLEARRFKRHNRRLLRGNASSKEVLSLLSSGDGRRVMRPQVVDDIRPDEVALFILCWASLLPAVRSIWEIGGSPVELPSS